MEYDDTFFTEISLAKNILDKLNLIEKMGQFTLSELETAIAFCQAACSKALSSYRGIFLLIS